MRSTYIFIAVALLVGLASCEKDDPVIIDTGYKHGAFIINEGAFGSSSASISYLNRDSSELINNLFYQVNSRPLGDIAQSFEIQGDRGYIVVNNSQKIEVVDMETFASGGVITGLSYPRYFLGVSDTKGYVSNGSIGGIVYVVNLETLAISDSIQIGNGPEEMILINNKVFVANSGGWISDNTISVIDVASDELIETIHVGDNPKGLVLDKNDDLWALCKGKVVYAVDWSVVEETKSELVRIDINTFEVEERIEIGQMGDFFTPLGIACDKEGSSIIFTESGGLYKMDIAAGSTPSSPFISGSFYGFGVDPEDGAIYGLNAGDFVAPGFVYRYNPDGVAVDTLAAGIAPNGVVFN